MFKVLRIICCIICALLLAVCVFVFIYAGTFWGIATVIGAIAFFALTMLFKTLQEDYEKKHGGDTKTDEHTDNDSNS